jgi:hypothetical protein
VRAASGPVSSESQKRVTADALVNTCREISKLLGQAKAPPALRMAAPQLAEALPLVKALVLGLEDLVDRVALIEASYRNNHHPHEIRLAE